MKYGVRLTSRTTSSGEMLSVPPFPSQPSHGAWPEVMEKWHEGLKLTKAEVSAVAKFRC